MIHLGIFTCYNRLMKKWWIDIKQKGKLSITEWVIISFGGALVVSELVYILRAIFDWDVDYFSLVSLVIQIVLIPLGVFGALHAFEQLIENRVKPRLELMWNEGDDRYLYSNEIQLSRINQPLNFQISLAVHNHGDLAARNIDVTVNPKKGAHRGATRKWIGSPKTKRYSGRADNVVAHTNDSAGIEALFYVVNRQELNNDLRGGNMLHEDEIHYKIMCNERDAFEGTLYLKLDIIDDRPK